MSDIRVTGNGSTVVGGLTVNTPYETKDQGVKVEDFLTLMVAQLQNQDFMNPTDDTQYVTQLAQFASMQAMQEVSQYSQTNYAMSLVGKTVTVASYGVGGSVNKDVGTVSKVSFANNEFKVTVNGKEYELSQIMYANDAAAGVDKNELEVTKKSSLIEMETTANNSKVRWNAPFADADKNAGLTYDVYYTTNGNVDFNDLATVKKGTNVATGLKTTEQALSGLEPDTTYFVNVVVRDANGNESVYQCKTIKTKTA